ncbi:MAG TPA: hypothetical protein VGV87_26135, partial [Blastocatellia bacterium]|nr:hypothetical protein [Blastocatellia bacterium]
SIFIACCASGAIAQQRPLLTEDVEVIKPGVIRIESGFEFLQNQRFAVSGLRGDLTRIADTRLSFGLASNVEFQIEWTVQNLLSIDQHGPSAIPLRLGASAADTNDVGDAKLWMKIKLRNESRRAPSLGFRFGVELPNSNQALGIGTNTTNFYSTVNAGKRFLDQKLNLFGNVGLGILQAPLNQFTQNDVLMYGVAGIYTVSDRFNVVGEVNGFHSTRKHAPIGTEDFSEARLGAQVRALGVRWNAAGVFGLSKNAPRTGLVLGITFDWEAFTPVK